MLRCGCVLCVRVFYLLRFIRIYAFFSMRLSYNASLSECRDDAVSFHIVYDCLNCSARKKCAHRTGSCTKDLHHHHHPFSVCYLILPSSTTDDSIFKYTHTSHSHRSAHFQKALSLYFRSLKSSLHLIFGWRTSRMSEASMGDRTKSEKIFSKKHTSKKFTTISGQSEMRYSAENREAVDKEQARNGIANKRKSQKERERVRE